MMKTMLGARAALCGNASSRLEASAMVPSAVWRNSVRRVTWDEIGMWSLLESIHREAGGLASFSAKRRGESLTG